METLVEGFAGKEVITRGDDACGKPLCTAAGAIVAGMAAYMQIPANIAMRRSVEIGFLFVMITTSHQA
jgi:hypothetical protein